MLDVVVVVVVVVGDGGGAVVADIVVVVDEEHCYFYSWWHYFSHRSTTSRVSPKQRRINRNIGVRKAITCTTATTRRIHNTRVLLLELPEDLKRSSA